MLDERWSSVSHDIPASSLCAEVDGTIWIAGLNKDIYMSTNSGDTWRLVLLVSQVPLIDSNIPSSSFQAPDVVCAGSTAWAQYSVVQEQGATRTKSRSPLMEEFIGGPLIHMAHGRPTSD